MKKTILILAGLAIAGFAFKDKILGTSSGTQSFPGSGTDNSFFSMYEGKIVVDPPGYWMVIVNGVIYTFSGQEGMSRWLNENSRNGSPIVEVDFPAWETYATKQVGGVGTLPGY